MNNNIRIQPNPQQTVNHQNMMYTYNGHMMLPNNNTHANHSPNSHNNTSKIMINYKDPIIVQKNPS